MNISGSPYTLHDVIQSYDDPVVNTDNFVRCFLEREKISNFVTSVLDDVKENISDLIIETGFVHPKIVNYKYQERDDLIVLNEFRGLVLKANPKRVELYIKKRKDVLFRTIGSTSVLVYTK